MNGSDGHAGAGDRGKGFRETGLQEQARASSRTLGKDFHKDYFLQGRLSCVMGFQAKRDYMDVCGEILRICLSPTMKSRIMQRANLGHRMFTRYLNYLSGAGLLEEAGGLLQEPGPRQVVQVPHEHPVSQVCPLHDPALHGGR